MPVTEALKKHDWVKDYFWQLVPVDQDKYTASAFLELHDGYVIRALPGSKSIYPIQACLYLDKENLQQNVHNLIIAEEGSELHIITGCATSPHMKRGVHVGISEFFVKKGAKLSFTMIHNWAEEMTVRPRSVARVEEGGVFINNYICMKPVRSIQMYPTTHLVGNDATAMFYSVIVGTRGSSRHRRKIFLRTGAAARDRARSNSNGAHINNRGHCREALISKPMECRAPDRAGTSIPFRSSRAFEGVECPMRPPLENWQRKRSTTLCRGV